VNLLSSQKQREIYKEYISDWQTYLDKSRQSIALARNHLNDQAIEAVRENSRGSFQALNKRLDSILKSNEKYEKSFSYQAKERNPIRTQGFLLNILILNLRIEKSKIS
jgi:hypothetical protein